MNAMQLLRIVLVSCLLLLLALPVVADGATELSDTLYVVKEGEALSNVEVAVALSQSTPLAPTRVLIGRDDVFVDSMTSGVLQGDSPLLLVPPAGPVPDLVLDELARMGPARVTLLGGENAVQPAVADQLSAAGYTVDRRQGASRFETAIAIAEDGPDTSTAILARAFPSPDAGDPTQGFADSLAAGGMAAENGWPILLTETDRLTPATADYMATAGFDRVLIMGGTAAISQATEDAVRTMVGQVDRIAGPTRFGTGVEVAKELGAESAADVDRVTLVDGQAADAWAGGFAAAAHSAHFDAPIVLATGEALPPETEAFLSGGSGGSAFAQDGTAIRLTCVIDSDICEEGRVELGLPPRVPVTFTPPTGSTVSPGSAVVVDVGTASATVSGGSCPIETPFPLPDDGSVELTSQPDGPTCDIVVTIDRGDGLVQTERATYTFGAPTSTLTLLSAGPDGTAVSGSHPDVAADGSAVVFVSQGDPSGQVGAGTPHVWVRGQDLELVDVAPDGSPATGSVLALESTRPRISADGRYVLFLSEDPGLDSSGAVGGQFSLYLRDRQRQETTLVGVDAQGSPTSQIGHFDLSGDGSLVVYQARGVGPTGADSIQVFVHDRAAGSVDVVRTEQGEPFLNGDVTSLDLSTDGSTIVFVSSRRDLVAADATTFADAYAVTWDRALGQTDVRLVSVDSQGTQGSNNIVQADRVATSSQGALVVFASRSTDLAGMGSTQGDVFLRDRAGQQTILVSHTGDGTTHLDAASRADIADNGATIAYVATTAPEGIAPADGCGVYRVTPMPLQVRRIDVAADGTHNTNSTCSADHSVVVADNGLVAFAVFDDLVPEDDNGGTDVYISFG
ncbi:cell wall-binding repeat-containing protein [Euzebya rosea]|uniref:cell wall-binding repeat-containing protein n=1 Tax=Euzebya rosea TaxID=2052804 RepID=UPI000D3EA1B8|nr:cell wall-binding repeat-containing protein [Euzebya rosea]